MSGTCTQLDAIELARKMEAVLGDHHVALTGGCLYKDGPRKDMDFAIYHSRSTRVNPAWVLSQLATIGVIQTHHYQSSRDDYERDVRTCSYGDQRVDLMFL